MGKLRVYCLKTLDKLLIYPLGNTPSAPSDKPQNMTNDPTIRWRTRARTRLDQSRKDDVSLSSIRKFRANHLGSNLHLGAEAQLVHHAVQTSQQ